MDWIVLTPPLLAIVLALRTREVYLSILAGLWLGTTIVVGGNPLVGLRELLDQLVAVFSDTGNIRIVFFCFLVGGLMALMQKSGGVEAFIAWAQGRGWGKTRRGAEVLAWLVGMVIFVESNITALATGAISRPLFDRLKIAREKLAFYCDVTSAPVCMMIPLNGWGAYILGLLAAQGVGQGAVSLLASALVFNFYAIVAIIGALVLAISGFGFGEMRRAEVRAVETGALIRPNSSPMSPGEQEIVTKAPYSMGDFMIPLITMIGVIFMGLYITGDGNLMQGSGSTSVLWAVSVAVMVGGARMLLPRKEGAKMNFTQMSETVVKGSSELFGVTLLVVFAIALGQVSRALEIGPYVAQLVGEDAPIWLIPALVFAAGSGIGFALGSSWTVFGIMIPVALPIAEALGIHAPLMLGAVLAGGVFGDHASPLSDTTIISSMSASCDHIDHVRTQLPYALVGFAVSLVFFLIAGLLV